MAIGFDELLLHGETRPFDVSSSQSNQRVFLRTRPFFGLQSNAKVCGGKAVAVSGQRPQSFLKILACDARTRFNRTQDNYNTTAA
jgi:hypothetical protein